jgi:hypothetical protein
VLGPLQSWTYAGVLVKIIAVMLAAVPLVATLGEWAQDSPTLSGCVALVFACRGWAYCFSLCSHSEVVKAVGSVVYAILSVLWLASAQSLLCGWVHEGLCGWMHGLWYGCPECQSMYSSHCPCTGWVYHRATGVPLDQALLKIHAVVHRQPVRDIRYDCDMR